MDLCGGDLREEFLPFVGSICFEDAVDGVEHLAGDCDQGLHLGFMAADQSVVEGPEVRVSLACDQGRHEEGMSQVPVACAADT